jgi:sulfite exporter TauE/SafE
MGLELGSASFVGLFAAFFAALTTGFLGSLHCVSMCGATIASAMGNGGGLGSRSDNSGQRNAGRIVVSQGGAATLSASQTITLGLPTNKPSVAPANRQLGAATLSTMRASLAFNAGRILSYVVAGALVAGVAGSLAERLVINDMTPLRLVFYVFGQCLVIATGFYIAGATKFLAPVERAGGWIWRHLQRWVAPQLQAHFSNGQARPFAFGALWGWIPCGLVYGTLATAMSSGSVEGGALIMLGFGLGTLPAMFMAGAAAVPLRQLAQRPRVRLAAGAIVIGMGLFGLSRTTQVADFAALAQLCIQAF